MKRIIPYCKGGLGNRLRSLASCHVIAQDTGRKLRIYWDNIVPNGCLARLDELFENNFDTITLEEMRALDDCKMCVNQYDADRESGQFENDTLSFLTRKFGAAGKHAYTYSDEQENILVYNNGFLNGISLEKSHAFLRSLQPTKEIQSRIDRIKDELELNKDVIGIHARGTDFLPDINSYISQMKPFIDANSDQKFFVSTEDRGCEEAIVNAYPQHVLFRKKENYTKREDENVSWSNHKNFCRSAAHSKEAIEDMFLLAETTIRIYDSRSTFTELAYIISTQERK